MAQKQQHKGRNKTLLLFKRQTKEQRLRESGVRIIRFRDEDVMNNIEGVMNEIEGRVKKHTP